MTAPEILRLDGIGFVHHSRQALTDTNLTIREGGHWALIDREDSSPRTPLTTSSPRSWSPRASTTRSRSTTGTGDDTHAPLEPSQPHRAYRHLRSMPCAYPRSGAGFDADDPVVARAGVAAAVGVVGQHPDRAVGCFRDIAQTAVLAHEVLGRLVERG